jgi:integrase
LILINAFLLCGRRCSTGRVKASTSCRQRQQDRGGSSRLPAAVVDALKLRREQQESARLAAGVEFWEDWGLVFTTRLGTPLSPRNDYRDFERLVGAAGLRHVRLHDLRHTAASLMLAQGVSPRVVMEILGHSQISVTMNTYSHVTPASSREAVARVEGLLFEGRSEFE